MTMKKYKSLPAAVTSRSALQQSSSYEQLWFTSKTDGGTMRTRKVATSFMSVCTRGRKKATTLVVYLA